MPFQKTETLNRPSTQKNSSKTIALIDNKKDLSILSTALKETHLNLIGIAQNSHSVIELVRKHKKGILFMDADLMNFEIGPTLKKLTFTFPDIRVVIISAIATKDLVETSLKNGAIGFIAKPLTEKTIMKVAAQI